MARAARSSPSGSCGALPAPRSCPLPSRLWKSQLKRPFFWLPGSGRNGCKKSSRSGEILGGLAGCSAVPGNHGEWNGPRGLNDCLSECCTYGGRAELAARERRCT